MSRCDRAVVVARCSTEEESQKEALVQQVKEAKQCIQEMNWELVDTYVEAKSGTTVKGRKEYCRLLEDMSTNKFDIIVIKSIDRLMRNTKDWYLFLDKLQQNKKRLYIYLERKFYTPEDSLITGIKAILAEEYSRELSKKIRNAHQHRQLDGTHFVITGTTYGYKNVNRETVINLNDVPLIKRIFELAAGGYGSYVIAKMLYEEGYRNRKGGMIAGHVVCGIIRNPIYTGDVVLNKKHYDFEVKRYIRNPQSEWIIRKNVVEPIISRELFELANAAVDSRSAKNSRKSDKPAEYVRYPLSGKLICGLCGKMYNRCTRKSKGTQIAEWKCSTYTQKGRSSNFEGFRRNSTTNRADGCDNIHLDESKLYEALKKFMEQHSSLDEDKIITFMSELLQGAIDTGSNAEKKNELSKNIDKLKNQKNVLIDKLLNEVITDDDYREKSGSIQAQIDLNLAELEKIDATEVSMDKVKHRIDELENLLRESVIEKAEVDHLLECIQSIVVYPEELQMHIHSLAFVGLGNDTNLKNLVGTDEVVEVIPSNSVRTGARPQIEEDKIIILEIMTADPRVTAKQIAQKNNWDLSRVNRRIAELKKSGILKYSTPNGRGYWIITK